MPPALEALRPRQWTKNLIVFAPLLFAERLGDLLAVGRAALGFAIFCLASGAIYVLNDLKDLERDRLHPEKSQRPIASGRLSPRQARWTLALVLGAALVGSVLLSPELVTRIPGSQTGAYPSFLGSVLIYVGLLAAYSFRLKHVVILDVMVIATGFVVRAVAGAVVIPVDISHWLLICTIFLALFLALAKRRHELALLAGDAPSHRATLGEYDPELLDQMISIVAAASVISYALYTMAPETVAKFGTDRLNVTIPFVVYGLFRYLYLVYRRLDGGDPSSSLLSDRPLLLAVLLWGLAAMAVLYS